MDRLFWIAGIFYALAALGHLLWVRDVLKNARIGKTMLIVGFLLHTAELFHEARLSGMFPVYNLRNALLFFSWCIVLLYAALLIRHRFELLSFFTVVLVLFFILPVELLPNPKPAADRPALQDWVTSIHIGLSVFSYAMFCLAALAAGGYLAEHRRLKRKGPQAFLLRLPPLEMLDAIQVKMARAGVAALGLGILFGGCWAYREGWTVFKEPKIALTMIVLFVYAALLAARARYQISSRRFSVALLAGFAACLLSFFVVNFLSGGKHHF